MHSYQVDWTTVMHRYGITDGLTVVFSQFRTRQLVSSWGTTRSHHTLSTATALASDSSTRAVQADDVVHRSLAGAAPAYLADECNLTSDVGSRSRAALHRLPDMCSPSLAQPFW